MRLELKIANGAWVEQDDSRDRLTADGFIAEAAAFGKIPEADVVTALEGGAEVRHGTDWYELIRDADAVKSIVEECPVATKFCACGHRVPAGLVMLTSRGTSCPDCYDRMSE